MQIVEILKEAAAGKWSMAAFNAPSFDAMIAIGQAGSDTGVPAIIQTSARLVELEGATFLKGQFDLACQLTGAKLFLHLDHCTDEGLIGQCVTAGWDMVMFDGSHLPIEENVSRTREIVRMAHAAGTAVEAEVGPVGGEEDGIEHLANYATAEDIEEICADSGIDCLAVGFGNVHGEYSDKSLLRWEILEGAKDLAHCPLVLHGGSGLTAAEFHRAISAGVAKINISTDLKKVYQAALSDNQLIQSVTKSPGSLHGRFRQDLQEVARKYISLFREEN